MTTEKEEMTSMTEEDLQEMIIWTDGLSNSREDQGLDRLIETGMTEVETLDQDSIMIESKILDIRQDMMKEEPKIITTMTVEMMAECLQEKTDVTINQDLLMVEMKDLEESQGDLQDSFILEAVMLPEDSHPIVNETTVVTEETEIDSEITETSDKTMVREARTNRGISEKDFALSAR
jgi:hypothetical protein